MKILQIPRGRGKTAFLLKLMEAEPETIYVAPTTMMADHAFKRARVLGYEIARERFVSATQLAAGKRGADMGALRRRKLLVDELELVLEGLLGSSVEISTTSHTELLSETPPVTRELEVKADYEAFTQQMGEARP